MAAVIRYASTASREGKAVLALAALGGPSAVTATPLSFEISTFEIDGSRSSWSAAERLPYDEESLGALRVAWLNSYAHKDGTLGHRLLLGSSEHSLQLLQVMTSLIAPLIASLIASLIAAGVERALSPTAAGERVMTSLMTSLTTSLIASLIASLMTSLMTSPEP